MGDRSLGVEGRRVLLVWINELWVGRIGALGFCSRVGVLALALLDPPQEGSGSIYLAGKVTRCGWRSV